MLITTRFYMSTHIARAKGHKTTASCAYSATRAAERLAEKLGHNPDLLELVEQRGNDCVFTVAHASPQEEPAP